MHIYGEVGINWNGIPKGSIRYESGASSKHVVDLTVFTHPVPRMRGYLNVGQLVERI